MKIGISAFAWTGSFQTSHLPLLAKARAFGFAAFEVPMFRPADLPIKALRAAYEANDLECTVCAILPPGVNPISPDKGQRERSVRHLRDCVQAAAEMGARLLGGPMLAPIGYLPGHRPTVDEWAWAKEACQSLLEVLSGYDITLSLEPVNRSETYFLRTAAEAKRLCLDVADSRFGVTIDTFHANIEEKSLTGVIKELGSHLKHMHMSESDRGLLGEGHIDFAEICDALHSINYPGLLIIEGFGYDSIEKEAPGYLWADPTVSPEDLAQSGLQFLWPLARPCPKGTRSN